MFYNPLSGLSHVAVFFLFLKREGRLAITISALIYQYKKGYQTAVSAFLRSLSSYLESKIMATVN